jgi:hypothetical protein
VKRSDSRSEETDAGSEDNEHVLEGCHTGVRRGEEV